MTETLLAFFKALADQSRLAILGLLAQREYTVQDLALALQLKEPTVSHHLAVLKAQQLVSVRPEGTQRWHSLDRAALEAMSRRVLEAAPDSAEPALEDSFDQRVLSAFVASDGRLKEIPAGRRKRAAVLRWLTRQFEPETRYREADVNALIQSRHWDSATLRREMVGHRMMAREAGVYWRLPEAEWETIAGPGG
ncbi:MAG TPA: metalloregulator ArsR/SmtB family transcription factor [Caulobacteraceae bacterium]|jgi:hypothetical protein|nr:metalloregulator ArsR/SmtB family transcription factor [Caulobacteraceae bacterium]